MSISYYLRMDKAYLKMNHKEVRLMYYSIIGVAILLVILTSFQYTLNKISRILEEININIKSLRGKI